MEKNRNDSARVILYIRVTDLPGSPQNRHNTLGNLFCQQILNRNFNNQVQVSNYDYMHLPPNFDTDKPVRRWFVFDLNVNCRLSKEEVLSLPHDVYSVSQQDDEWRFLEKPHYVDKAKNICSTYCWGGRREQELVAQMKEAATADSRVVGEDT